MIKENVLKAIKELRESSKKRKFPQSIDLIVNLKEYDLKKHENKFIDDVILPNGRGKDIRVVVFSDTIKTDKADIIGGDELMKMSKREARNLVKKTEFFLAEPKLMPVVGKILGQFIGPRGKLPKIVSGDVDLMIKNYEKSVRIRVKDAPVIQCLIGKESMSDGQLTENIEAIMQFLEKRLPKGKNNIGKVLLKFTMSKLVKVEI